MKKHHYIFFSIILVLGVLSGNIVLAGSGDMGNGKMGVRHPFNGLKRHQIALVALNTPNLITASTNASQSEIPKPEKPIISEQELKIKVEAICDFLESERPEKYLSAEICK